MKRFIIVVVLALVGVVVPHDASAQFDLSKIGGMLGGSSSQPKTSPYQALADNAPAKGKIVGAWSYDSFNIEYLGNNSFAGSAIAQVELYAQQEVAAAGVTPGCYAITLRSNGRGVFMYGDYAYECGYSYDASTAHVELNIAMQDGSPITCNGFVKMKGERLGFMLNAEDVVRAVAKLAPEVVADQTYLTIKSVVDSFPGIYITTYYNR